MLQARDTCKEKHIFSLFSILWSQSNPKKLLPKREENVFSTSVFNNSSLCLDYRILIRQHKHVSSLMSVSMQDEENKPYTFEWK